MRYAIFSDIHGNRPAWDAVLKDMRDLEVDVFVCLGDIVGYGPKPQEVLAGIRSVTSNFVLGNHDAAAAGILDASVFNPQAREVIEWTRNQLNEESIQFLHEMPLAIEDEAVLFVHAEMEEPGRFLYIDSEEEARANFQAVRQKITFVGHTHHPCIFVEKPDGSIKRLPDDDRILEGDSRYIINVGSVGEPRNPNDIRARYVIYDNDTQTVAFRRIEFDVEIYRAELRASGLKVTPYFLRVVDHYQEALAQSQAAGAWHAMMVDMQTTSIRPVTHSTSRRQLVMPSPNAQMGRPKPTLVTPPAKKRSPAVVATSITMLLAATAGAIIWFNQNQPKPGVLVVEEQDRTIGPDASAEGNSMASMVADAAGVSSPGSGTPLEPDPTLSPSAPIPTEAQEPAKSLSAVGENVKLPAPKPDAPDPASEKMESGPREKPILSPAKVISHWKMDDPKNSPVFADSIGKFPLSRYQTWSPLDPIAPDPVPLTLQTNKSSARVRLLGEQPDNAGTFALKKEAGFTYEGWFHAGNQNTATLGSTLNGDVPGGWRAALLRGEGQTGFAAFMYENGETKVQALGRDLNIFDNQAHHFAAVWNPKAATDAGRLSIFVDNKPVGAAMLPHANVAGGTSNPFQVGSDQSGITVDELRFSATALTPGLFLTAGATPTPGDYVLFDFEGDTFDGWVVEGTAFGSQPASVRVTARKAFSEQAGQQVAHSSHGGDGPTGKLTSAAFKVTRRYLRALVAGGPHQGQTYVGLEIDGKLVHSTTGQENLDFREVLWDLSPFANKEAKFVAVDEYGGRWGVIAFDHVVLTDEPGKLTALPPLP